MSQIFSFLSHVGKLSWTARKLRKSVGQNHSPFRGVHAMLHKAGNPVETIQRKTIGKRLATRMSGEARAALAEFEEQGLVNVDRLIDRSLLAELDSHFQRNVRPRSDTVAANTARPFFFPLQPRDSNTADGIATRFALQSEIIAMVSVYMGKLPFLRNLNFLESRSIGQEKWEQSQLWHLDYYFTPRTPSLWVYLNDVREDADGPFTYLPAPASARVRKNLIPRSILDSEIEEDGLSHEIKRVMGPRLTCFLADNSRVYHLGSRMGEGRVRQVFIAHFVDPVNEVPWIKPATAFGEDYWLVFARR